MRNKYATNHVLLRDGVFYFVRRVPLDLAEHYSVKRPCFSSRAKSYKYCVFDKLIFSSHSHTRTATASRFLKIHLYHQAIVITLENILKILLLDTVYVFAQNPLSNLQVF